MKKKLVVHRTHNIIKGKIKIEGIDYNVQVPLCSPKRRKIAVVLTTDWKQVTCKKCLELR